MPALADILHPVSPSWSVRVNYQSFLLPYLWRSWLFDAGSLTARLKALRPGQFRVEVLNQYYDSPTSVERTEMRLSSNQKVWVREVVLMLGEVAVVYARTAIRSEEHTSELQSRPHLVCRLLLEKKKKKKKQTNN